jgi:hypothetical protein
MLKTEVYFSAARNAVQARRGADPAGRQVPRVRTPGADFKHLHTFQAKKLDEKNTCIVFWTNMLSSKTIRT